MADRLSRYVPDCHTRRSLQVLILAYVATVTIGVVGAPSWMGEVSVIYFVLGLLFGFGRRIFRSVDALLHRAGRRHAKTWPHSENFVLYLRPFADDGMTLSTGQHQEKYEENLVRHAERLAPCYAVEDPRRTLSIDRSAVPLHFADENWELRMNQLMGASNHIIAIIGGAPGIIAEWRMITYLELLDRVVAVLPPESTKDRRSRWELFLNGLEREGVDELVEQLRLLPYARMTGFFFHDGRVVPVEQARDDTQNKSRLAHERARPQQESGLDLDDVFRNSEYLNALFSGYLSAKQIPDRNPFRSGSDRIGVAALLLALFLYGASIRTYNGTGLQELTNTVIASALCLSACSIGFLGFDPEKFWIWRRAVLIGGSPSRFAMVSLVYVSLVVGAFNPAWGRLGDSVEFTPNTNIDRHPDPTRSCTVGLTRDIGRWSAENTTVTGIPTIEIDAQTKDLQRRISI